ncbi:MAG: hypothetical protein ACC613_09680 [Synergistales bacterium]
MFLSVAATGLEIVMEAVADLRARLHDDRTLMFCCSYFGWIFV